MTKKRTSDDCEFIFNSDGTVKDIKVPDHLRPDISLDDDWYKDMMNDIRDRLKTEFQARQPPVILSAQVIDKIAQRVNAEASYMSDVSNESQGRGRPVNIGSELAAAGAQKIAKEFNLPAQGDWEESTTADLLTLIEEVSRLYKDRMEPASGNRKARLIKGRNWKITDL